jgi:ABC-type Fe3+-hydroxamate transport system substrate-binding protein
VKNIQTRILPVFILIMILTSILAGLIGCASNQTSPPPSANAPVAIKSQSAAPAAPSSSPAATTRSITDMLGKTVTIPVNLQRVAVLTSPQTIEMYILGEQAKLCAISNAIKQWNFLGQIDPRVKTLPAVRAQVAQVNIEALLQANPDICIGSDMDMQVVN